MKQTLLHATYGFLIGILIFEAAVGEWRAVLCAVLGLIMIRLATQGEP